MKHDHEAKLSYVRADMPTEENLGKLAELFKSFGDETRMRILYALSLSDMCVCAIAELLHMEQSAISHQLKKLRQAKLVTSRKEGRTVYYMLDDDHVRELVAVGFAHLMEE
ncbi:MAG: winged helix-turn-helix transcriptional regulator [Oscillospiraceae bacterium]|nr:winged helix-turn-helix transcriptional regulator [Oscillospiraceae bacterium]